MRTIECNNSKLYTMPISYHGFAPAAILIMVACLAGKQLYDYWKQYQQKL